MTRVLTRPPCSSAHEVGATSRLGRKLRARRSPRIPVELWGEVFQWCLPQDGATTSLSDPPCTFTQVCRFWRAVALSTPRLWASLTIDATQLADDEEATVAGIRSWLCRSDPLPFALTVRARDNYGRLPRPCLCQFSELIVDYAHRWRHLQLHLPGDWFDWISFAGGQFTSLSCLGLHSSSFSASHSSILDMEWQTLPPLRQITVSGLMFDPSSLHIDYAQITELVILPQHTLEEGILFTLDDVLNILSQASRLTKFACLVDDRLLKWKTEVSSNVEELDLCFKDCGANWNNPNRQANRMRRLDRFFSLLRNPNTRSLSIGYSSTTHLASTPWPHDSFLSYLSNSSSNLESLSLKYLPVVETQIIQYLQRAPALTHLTVEVQPTTGSQRAVGDLLMAALTFMDWRCPLVPRLESLDFRNCGRRCSEAAVSFMIETRNVHNLVAKLKTIKYSASRTPHSLMTKLEELLQRGFRIDVEVVVQ
ncbi:hypothetical protein CCMSSC00406_0003691 [Pleurotus cornucopiae]|uniref:Uncharacterized protein n=1 Tax=Pleurotus cornucopiae TaxID=5321 RepID=A0ACB7IQV0_PLECO|nr:hypothetical protein CCMSSC00406_0003691 [Pleurotus cornucopiae]